MSAPGPAGPFAEVVNRDPYEYYQALLDGERAVWDDSLKAWVVPHYADVKEVLGYDLERIHHPDRDEPARLHPIFGGSRSLKFMDGELQREVHQWWLRTFGPKTVERCRSEMVVPLVDALLDQFCERGRAELSEELAEQLPIRVVAGVLGLPADDADWVDECRRLMNVAQAYLTNRLIQTDEMTSKSIAAADQLHDLLRPAIEERRSGEGPDLISLLWRDGPSLRDDWNENDVLAGARDVLVGGTDTTTHAICNMVYLLTTSPPDVQRSLNPDGGTSVGDFVEETLRLYTPVHFRVRKADEPIECAGASIQKGDSIVTVLATANRDPGQYEAAAEPVIGRKAARDHVTFSWGRRACVGAALARMELQTVLAALLRRVPDLALDPSGPAPTMEGFALRSFRPLHVTFTPSPRRT